MTIETSLIERAYRYAGPKGADLEPVQTEITELTIVQTGKPSAFKTRFLDPILCLVLQGTKENLLGQERILFTAGQAAIISLEVPAASRVIEASADEPFVCLALSLDLAILRSLAEEVDLIDKETAPARPVASGLASDELIHAMQRLFALTGSARDRQVMAPLIIREAHYWALISDQGTMLRRLTHRDGAASRIRNVLTHLRNDCAALHTIPDMAALAGMSISSFHDHFRDVTASTPLQYLKDLRLLEARRLLSEGADNVSRVAYAVGYQSPTQFSREYSRKFGNPPKTDRFSPMSQTA